MIPFNKPVWLGTEPQRMTDAIRTNGHVAGGGPFSQQCEAWLSRHLGQPALLVTSGTHALELAALLLDVGHGDEIIMPSFTFVSTANAVVLRGGRPVFADVDANGNIEPTEVDRRRTSRTKAVVVVHYAGNSCDMRALASAAASVPIIEDAAQALGASFEGQPLGTFGVCAAFSFHETKNVGCGEGGALTVRDSALLDRAMVMRDKGTNRRRFMAGLVDKYTWVDVGSSYALSDLNAAYLSVQLEAFAKIQHRRDALHHAYVAALRAPVADKGGYLIEPGPGVSSNHHLLGIVWSAPAVRDRFIAYMRDCQIITPFHYVALHESPFGRAFHDGGQLPMTERLSTCLCRLPLFYNLADADQDVVVGRTLEFLNAL